MSRKDTEKNKESYPVGQERSGDDSQTSQLWFEDSQLDLNNERKHRIKPDTNGEKEVI